ncbi:MAG: P63C domain-containing protein [Erythrobacter sp.]
MPKNEQIIEPINASFDDVARAMTPAVAADEIVPSARYGGILAIGEIQIPCYVLEDGTRVIHQRGMVSALGMSRGGSSRGGGDRLAHFVGQKTLSPFVSSALEAVTKEPLVFRTDRGAMAYGYDATVLADICEAVLEARKQGALSKQQTHIADKAELLVRAFARVGIVALVDEATGFQRDRGHDALRLLLEQYIADGLQKWIHTFPDSFFAELDRLYDNAPTTSRSRPQYYGKFINKYVYDPIEHGYMKAELDKLNITDEGKRRARFHQWLTDEGRTILTRQIGKVEGIMEMCEHIEQFKEVAKRRKAVTVAPYLFDEMNRIID